MSEQEVNTNNGAILALKAVMLEKVVPILLSLLGFLGVQLLDRVEVQDTRNDQQDRELVALQRDLKYMGEEINRLRDDKE